MNKKVSLIILTLVLAIIIFAISTALQKQLINYVPTIKCLVATTDVDENTQASIDDFKTMDIPIEFIANVKAVKNFNEIENLYLKSKIYKGQIALSDQFDTKENLMIFNGEEGKEKAAIKIKGSENGVSYTVKKGSIINVYATISNEYANSQAFEPYEKISAGSTEYGFTTFKLLNEVKILGLFDENGEEVENMPERVIDTVLISVLPEEAYKINLIRDLATFNITEI